MWVTKYTCNYKGLRRKSARTRKRTKDQLVLKQPFEAKMSDRSTITAPTRHGITVADS